MTSKKDIINLLVSSNIIRSDKYRPTRFRPKSIIVESDQNYQYHLTLQEVVQSIVDSMEDLVFKPDDTTVSGYKIVKKDNKSK